MKIQVCPDCGQYCGRHFPGCPEEEEEPSDRLEVDTTQEPDDTQEQDQSQSQ